MQTERRVAANPQTRDMSERAMMSGDSWRAVRTIIPRSADRQTDRQTLVVLRDTWPGLLTARLQRRVRQRRRLL